MIAEESLTIDGGPMIFKTVKQRQKAASSDIQVEYNNFARGGVKPKTFVSSNRSVLSQYKRFAGKKNEKYDACSDLVATLMDYLRSSFIFDPNPKLMRTYDRIGNSTLAKNGANLSSVLYALSEGSEEEKQSLTHILEWIRQVPEEPYKNIEFVKTDLNDVIFGLRETREGPFIDARLLSDGTLRALAVLTALETATAGSRLVIEEFDNGLHPSRVNVLIEAMASCCERRQLNVLVTTHNPATLNTLQHEQLNSVIMCAWNSEQKAFNLINFYDLPRYDELIERGGLGDLVTRRVVERHLAPNFEKEHKEKALAWLRSLP